MSVGAGVNLKMTEVEYDPFANDDLARAVPTTEPQRELWLADQLGRDASLAFNESVSLSLEGALDVQALQDALLALSDRHETLRATITADGSGMMVAPRGTLRATWLDLSALDDAARDERLEALRIEAVETPFDLVAGPLVRALLVKLGAQRHQLLITAHHIVCDGWSFGVIADELMQLYAAIAAGDGPGTLPPADSFCDHALAERSGSADADEAWWLRQFDGSSPPVLELPLDRPRPARRGFASRREDLRLEAPLVDAVRRLGAERGASLFHTLFALFAGLMSRLGGDSDVVVGVPSAAQAQLGLPRMVGHGVNLLPVRVEADLALPFEQFLAHSRGRVIDATEHPGCTFGRLLGRLQLARDASRLPLVSVQFNIDSAISSQSLSRAGLTVALRSNPRRFENFELFVNASQVEGALVLECQYNTGLFDAATVRRWLKLFSAAVERAVAEPQAPLGRLFAAGPEDQALLAQWNATAQPWPLDQRVEDLLAEQSARTPEAVAVHSGERQVTHRELQQRANALAFALRERGIGPGHLVGLACGRNEHLLPALLGILKSGAGYVPLDPAFPAERLAHIRADAALQCIVLDRSAAHSPVLGNATPLWMEHVTRDERSVPPLGTADDPAYVIFTSGSTGLPKGVVLPHRAVVNFLKAVAQRPGLGPDDKLVAVTTTSFDIAVLELLLPLLTGGQVVLAERETVVDGAALRTLLATSGATAMQATPSGWRLLLEAGWPGRKGFKALVGGEALPEDLRAALAQRCGELWNLYGPTETTVWSTCWRADHAPHGIRIGTPIANTVVEVLDPWLQPCPIGVPGELFIGGAGVASGYLDRAELTAEKFVDRPAGRFYRTGDRARWCNDGQLEYLGRLDFQVKLRGHRIELGEIEAQLARLPGVERCVALVREDQPGDMRLVAYVVPVGAPPAPESLRDGLRRTLPEYMLPQHLVMLNRIPLLPNGKIDRKALPAPERDASAGAPAAPRNALEGQVLALFEQTLNLPGLGLQDDFFALGGHSLLAARLTARLNQALDLALPLSTVFERPTVEGLAARVAELRHASAAPARRIVHRPELREAPLTPAQERIRFMEEMQPGRVVYNTPSAHRLRGPLDREAFGFALQQMVQRQPALRTAIVVGEQGPVQRLVDGVTLDLPFIDLGNEPEATREAELMRRLQAEIDQPMPIAQAPLCRAALYRLGPDEHVFFFMAHHIVWDGWSFDLLYQELAALYPAALKGAPVALPPPAVSPLDHAHWHAQWLQGDEAQAQVQYWKQRYARIQPPRALPTDHPRNTGLGGMSGHGAVEWVHVDATLTEGLRALATRHGATLNMLVLAVYAAMMGQALASRSMVVGVPVRGRASADVEATMGFFNNLLPAHFDVDTALPLADWLQAVKRELLAALAHQDVPFERLAREPEIAVHAQRAGLYQCLFSFQDARERERRWGPLDHASVLVMQKGATEDLSLWLMEVPGGLEGGINYNADLFDASTARLFHQRLLALLQRVVEQPALTLAELLAAPGADASAFAAWVQARRVSTGSAPVLRADAAPLSAEQARLAAVWARLLGLPENQVAADDNFFDLGGSSLLVMEAAAIAERELGLRVDPRRFVNESLRQLAVPVPAVLPAAAEPRAAAPRGWMARVFGRIGQRE